MSGIVWIASYPKSGNTWVRLFTENLLSDAVVPVHINAPKLFSTYDSIGLWYQEAASVPFNYLDKPTVLRHRAKVHQRIAELTDGNTLVKTHSANVAVDGVPLITDDYTAGAVYIVRNPLDVVLSFSHHMDLSIGEAIRRMSNETQTIGGTFPAVTETISSWSTHVDSWTRRRNDSVLVLRYEDMVEDPLASFERIARHLRIDASSEALERAVAHTSFGVLREQERRGGFGEAMKGREFFRAGTTQQWRERLTREQIDELVRDNGATMERFGYVTDEMPRKWTPRSPAVRLPITKLTCRSSRRTPGLLATQPEPNGFSIRL
jgi:hypothetical protein